MKLKVKAIAAAVALAIGGTAAADPIGAEGIFFSAWNGNPDAPSSILINLGFTTDEFLANPSQAFSLSGTSLATLSSWLGSVADISRVEWGVSGAMLGASPSPTYGALSTATNAEAPDAQYGWGMFTGLDATIGNFSIFLDISSGQNTTLASTDAFAASNVNQLFSPAFNGGLGIDGLSTVGSAMSFYQFFADQDGNEFFEGDLIEHGAWSLVFDAGQAALTYAAAAPVPLPAAGWLLLSSILGLAGIARRKAA